MLVMKYQTMQRYIRRAKISFKLWWKPENMIVEIYAQDLIKIL